MPGIKNLEEKAKAHIKQIDKLVRDAVEAEQAKKRDDKAIEKAWRMTVIVVDEANEEVLRGLYELLRTQATGDLASAIVEKNALNFVDQVFSELFHQSCSVAMELANPDRFTLPNDIRTRTSNWVLNGKGVARQAEAEFLLRRRGATVNRPDWVTWQSVQAELGNKSRPNQPAVLIDIAQFRRRDFANGGWVQQGGRDEVRYLAWVVMPARKGLADVELIDIGDSAVIKSYIDRFNQTIKICQDRYARQSTPSGPAKVAPPIQAGDYLQGAMLSSLDSLWSAILKNSPAQKEISDQESWWILSPAADIWLVPFQAIVVEGSPYRPVKYAVEKHRISYVISGRDMIPTPFTPVKAGKSLIVGNPDFDFPVPDKTPMSPSRFTERTTKKQGLARGDVSRWENALVALTHSSQLLDRSIDRSVSRQMVFDFASPVIPRPKARDEVLGNDQLVFFHGRRGRWTPSYPSPFPIEWMPCPILPPPSPRGPKPRKREYNELLGSRLGTFTPLPGTEPLAIKIATEWGAVRGDGLLLGRSATERAIKERTQLKSQSPERIAFCTHGFGLSQESGDDPLSHCGLAFTGANISVRASGADTVLKARENDGILTGREIVDEMDLRGTRLVLQVACQTNVGALFRASPEAIAGDGVASLRHAFLMAGSEAVIATSWEVTLKESEDLITRFLANLKRAPTNEEDALRQAQIGLVKTHPFHWAAYSITYRPSTLGPKRSP
jgi:hypothetical protein